MRRLLSWICARCGPAKAAVLPTRLWNAAAGSLWRWRPTTLLKCGETGIKHKPATAQLPQETTEPGSAVK